MLTAKNKRILIIASVAALAVILVVTLWWYPAVKDINQRYPSYTVNEIARGGTANINEISLTAENLRFYSIQDFQKNFFNSDTADSIMSDVFKSFVVNDTEVALVDYNITYNGDWQATPGEIIDEYIIYLQSGFLSFTYDMLFLSYVNNRDEIPRTLNAGDSFKVTLPYFISKEENGIKSLDELTQKGISAVVNYYPGRYFIQL